MADDLIPPDIRDFIQRYIDSVAQLEALLLLRASPTGSWDVAQTARRLYGSEQEIAAVLERLCAEGLLTCESGLYRYQCSAEMQQKVDRVALVYSTHLIPVTNIIHGKPRRIREFADAFKLRRDS